MILLFQYFPLSEPSSFRLPAILSTIPSTKAFGVGGSQPTPGGQASVVGDGGRLQRLSSEVVCHEGWNGGCFGD
jgi:hypothetical protein